MDKISKSQSSFFQNLENKVKSLHSSELHLFFGNREQASLYFHVFHISKKDLITFFFLSLYSKLLFEIISVFISFKSLDLTLSNILLSFSSKLFSLFSKVLIFSKLSNSILLSELELFFSSNQESLLEFNVLLFSIFLLKKLLFHLIYKVNKIIITVINNNIKILLFFLLSFSFFLTLLIFL
jgi:hypothetical protein